jgi:outer membrane protein OmpA-like peptidoglycan-associated protein
MTHYLKTSLLLTCLLALTACSFNPFTTQNDLTGSPAGVAVGAAVGAGSAAALGVSSKPTLGLAALGGAAIGYYVTTIRFDSAGIVQGGGQVFTLGDYATIVIPSDRLFDVNSSELLPEAEPILKSVVNVLNHFPDHNILVSGNTSGFGSDKRERALSEARAREVAAFLWTNGIGDFKPQSLQTRKLMYVGYGDYFPIANNITAKGIRQNSRIQITAYPCHVKLGRQFKAFNNVGGLDDSPPPSENTTSIDNAFPEGDTLPDNNGTTRDDFKDAFNEGPSSSVISPNEPKSSDYFKEQGVKGEIQEDNISSSVSRSRSAGTVSKQGGYKGEGFE